MVALLDASSDRGFKAMTPSFRISDEYAQDLGKVVSYLNDLTNLPVWLVGMSLGSFSASNGAIRNLEGVDGLVLVSSVTRSAERWPLHDTHPKGILDMGLDKVKVPTLIVAHKGDTCPDTLASRVPEIKGALVHAPKPGPPGLPAADPTRVLWDRRPGRLGDCSIHQRHETRFLPTLRKAIKGENPAALSSFRAEYFPDLYP